jgi:hypothetical protein
MNFDDPDGKHKDFKNYVQFSLGNLAVPDKGGKDNKILEAMTKFSKLPIEQTRKFLGFGTKPLIKLGFKSMRDNIKVFPENIFVSTTMVEDFEAKKKSASLHTNRGGSMPSVGVFLIEAIVAGSLFVFSSDEDDRDVDKLNGVLKAFEKDVYGGIKSRM